MPDPLHIFIQTGARATETMTVLETCVGTSFLLMERDIGNVRFANVLGTELSLYEADDFEDDCEIPFSEYQVAVKLTPLN